MDNKTKGAWILHHAEKLQGAHTPGAEFENLQAAGKAGRLLSVLAASSQSVIEPAQLGAFFVTAGINRLEQNATLDLLAQRALLVRGANGAVEVLGLTNASVMLHTAETYAALGPSNAENATLDLAEKASVTPVERKDALEYLSDMHKFARTDAEDLLDQSSQIGFVDAEQLDASRQLYFNGNLFRHEDARKIAGVMSSLSTEEQGKVNWLDQTLRIRACLPLPEAEVLLGAELFSKIHSIGMLDVSGVSNNAETVYYVTRPAAFGKYGDPFADDALDLAKAFVSCLTYGMTRSSAGRGRIQALRPLVSRLIAGDWVGPATAIGEDYRVLELKRVIQLQQSAGNRYFMKLLKREVGELALAVLTEGDASDMSVPGLPGVPATSFQRPETSRVARRKETAKTSRRATAEMLLAIRTARRP
jgi:hypothetical protein